MEKLINEAGVRAVRKFVTMSGGLSEETIPERFLSCAMAIEMHSLGEHWHVHPEYPYQDLCKHLGVGGPYTLVQGCTADIALYDHEKPVAIIEVKKLRNLPLIGKDLQKAEAIAELSQRLPAAYAAVLVCETETPNGNLEAQLEKLGRTLRQQVHPSEFITAQRGGWRWCMATARAPRPK